MEVNERMKGYRVRQRAAGLRLIQLWVPDTRSSQFAAECRRQSRLMRSDPAETEALELIASAGAWDDDAPR
ncbi:MAG: antitoxin MazE family protein [Pseudomonadota bacterium]